MQHPAGAWDFAAPNPRYRGQRGTRELAASKESTCLFQHDTFKTFFLAWLSRDTSMKRQTVFQANTQCFARCKKTSTNVNYSPPLKKKIHKSTSNYQDDDANLFIYKRIKRPWLNYSSGFNWRVQLTSTRQQWSSAISVKLQEPKLKLQEHNLNSLKTHHCAIHFPVFLKAGLLHDLNNHFKHYLPYHK